MPNEPAVKRTIAFVDGQNLYHHARSAFGYTYPNYEVQKLAQAVCVGHGWNLERVGAAAREREHAVGDVRSEFLVIGIEEFVVNDFGKYAIPLSQCVELVEFR